MVDSNSDRTAAGASPEVNFQSIFEKRDAYEPSPELFLWPRLTFFFLLHQIIPLLFTNDVCLEIGLCLMARL